MSLIHEQVKEILATLSLAYDNFLDVNFPSNTNNSSNTLLHRSPGKNIHRNLQASNYRVRKFNRPGRRPVQAQNNGSSSSGKCDATRKRSWTVEDGLMGAGEDGEDTGEGYGYDHHEKRSRSLILLEELESITESLKNQALKMDEDYYHTHHTNTNTNSLASVFNEISRFEDIDEILKVLSTITSTPPTANTSFSFQNWLKWRVMLRIIEASESKGVKICLNRANLVSKCFDHLTQTGLINWSDDVEFIFLFLRFMSILLHSSLSLSMTAHSTAVSFLGNMRKMEEFNGIGKFFTFFLKNCIKFSGSKASFQFLLSRPDSSDQILFLLESLLEVNLNIFETFTILLQHQQQSQTQTQTQTSQTQHHLKIIINFLLISLKLFEFFLQETAADLESIKKFICRIKLITIN